jgi:hypothetical protein
VTESDAEFQARGVVRAVGPTSLPAPVERYAAHLGAVIRIESDLPDGQSGFTFQLAGKTTICVNGNETAERQRFTICHELGHLALGLPTDHDSDPTAGVVKRTHNEMLCDVFASELLLPVGLFQPLVMRVECSMEALEQLARECGASLGCTGSRYAAFAPTPCAFVFSLNGRVRYAHRSTSLRQAGGWIEPRTALPEESVSARARAGELCDGPREVEPDIWFSEWDRAGSMLEDARHLAKWDQTLTLLWFEDVEDLPPARAGSNRQGEEDGLAELTGELPWPGRRRQR